MKAILFIHQNGTVSVTTSKGISIRVGKEDTTPQKVDVILGDNFFKDNLKIKSIVKGDNIEITLPGEKPRVIKLEKPIQKPK